MTVRLRENDRRNDGRHIAVTYANKHFSGSDRKYYENPGK